MWKLLAPGVGLGDLLTPVVQYSQRHSVINHFDRHITHLGDTGTDHSTVSPRFLCRSTTLYIIARAVERQSAIYTENS
jgi:hypothetical protein